MSLDQEFCRSRRGSPPGFGLWISESFDSFVVLHNHIARPPLLLKSLPYHERMQRFFLQLVLTPLASIAIVSSDTGVSSTNLHSAQAECGGARHDRRPPTPCRGPIHHEPRMKNYVIASASLCVHFERQQRERSDHYHGQCCLLQPLADIRKPEASNAGD